VGTCPATRIQMASLPQHNRTKNGVVLRGVFSVSLPQTSQKMRFSLFVQYLAEINVHERLNDRKRALFLSCRTPGRENGQRKIV